MFEIGDKVVCINNTDKEHLLNLYQIYEVKKNMSVPGKTIYVINLKNEPINFYQNYRFISLQEYRKIKLEKLKECLK